MQVNRVNFIKEFFERMSSEFAIDDLAKDQPEDVRRVRRRIQKYGYPKIESEGEYIFWDEFSKRYGLEPPQWKPRQYSTTQ